MNCLRIFVTEDFHDFMTASKLSEQVIVTSAHKLANGLFDADLSGNVYKKRIAPTGRSKSGFGRAIVAFRLEEKIFLSMAG
ncbi:type II toxin-antitoxin system RelE/ParE family toxin [Rahnella perminowiae]|uniref:type II toxin-antitoxin system RelE/ParE family toxin n=1 Tax=Rahnella perminowiae TaxID=2816244 RepID=UPI001F2AE53A